MNCSINFLKNSDGKIGPRVHIFDVLQYGKTKQKVFRSKTVQFFHVYFAYINVFKNNKNKLYKLATILFSLQARSQCLKGGEEGGE